jgi:hypothetical protein
MTQTQTLPQVATLGDLLFHAPAAADSIVLDGAKSVLVIDEEKLRVYRCTMSSGDVAARVYRKTAQGWALVHWYVCRSGDEPQLQTPVELWLARDTAKLPYWATQPKARSAPAQADSEAEDRPTYRTQRPRKAKLPQASDGLAGLASGLEARAAESVAE